MVARICSGTPLKRYLARTKGTRINLIDRNSGLDEAKTPVVNATGGCHVCFQ